MDSLNKKTRDSLFEPCGNVLKNGKPCQFRKILGRVLCRRCLDRKRMAEDPTYRQKRNDARSPRTSACPFCGNSKAYSAKMCTDCRFGNALPWDQVAVLYSYRNPKDPMTKAEAKKIGDAAMQKIRRCLADPGDSPLSDALEALKGDLYG